MEAPESFQGGYCHTGNPQFNLEKRNSDDPFIIEDLLDFSNEDIGLGDDQTFGNSTDSSTVTVVDSCNSSMSGFEPHFSGDMNCPNFPEAHFSDELCGPYDDIGAELEWLSNFVEESFSNEDMEKMQLISGLKARPEQPSESREFQPEPNRNNTNPIFSPDISVPGKARSKRSRAAPCNWSSRLLVLSQSQTPTPATSSSESDIGPSFGKKTVKVTMKKKDISDGISDGRKCLHCATDKTPQWRTGPLGPKTLCNACGVRYKSGRLVPEYRPAASPTFQLTQHSNSHRKVLELRRQKEMQKSHYPNHHQQYLHPNNMFNISNGDDYLIHHRTGPDFRQLI